jgi:biopolymer transport protein ExbD
MNFRRRSKPVPIGFQLAPMIDIMFLLLCVFMSAQIYAQWETEIDIKLPTAVTGDLPDRLPSEIIINIKSNGVTVINQRQLDAEALSGLLMRIVEIYPGQPVLIRADLQTPYEHVIRTLDMCRKADIWNISFATTAAGEQ